MIYSIASFGVSKFDAELKLAKLISLVGFAIQSSCCLVKCHELLSKPSSYLHGHSAILDVNEIWEVEAQGLVIEVVLAGIVEVLVDKRPGEGWRYVGWDLSSVTDF